MHYADVRLNAAGLVGVLVLGSVKSAPLLFLEY
jgi:hypothetical protein